MSFLKQLLAYKRICIQCHNNPDADAVASAFGIYLTGNSGEFAAQTEAKLYLLSYVAEQARAV